MPKTEFSQSQDANNPQEPELGQENNFWTPGRVRILAASVVLMSVILIVGFGALIYKMVQLSLAKPTEQSKSINTEVGVFSVNEQAPDFELNLNGYSIRHISSDGRILTLHVEKADNAEIWLIDSRTKKMKSRIKLKR